MKIGPVALTGATGMVGTHLINQFESIGVPCAATSTRNLQSTYTNVDWSYWDIAQWKSDVELDALFPDVNAVVHLASIIDKANCKNEKSFYDVNVRSSINLAAWALRRNLYFVYISSSTVYSEPTAMQITENSPTGSPVLGGEYAVTKVMTETMLGYFFSQGLKGCILRPSSLYGLGLPKDKMIIKFLDTLSSEGSLQLCPPLFDRVNLLHADDLVEAIIMCLKKAVNGIYNIRGPFDYSVLEIAEICAQVTGGSLHVQQDKQDKGKLLFDLNGDAALQDIGYKGSIDLVDGLGKIHNSGN